MSDELKLPIPDKNGVPSSSTDINLQKPMPIFIFIILSMAVGFFSIGVFFLFLGPHPLFWWGGFGVCFYLLYKDFNVIRLSDRNKKFVIFLISAFLGFALPILAILIYVLTRVSLVD